MSHSKISYQSGPVADVNFGFKEKSFWAVMFVSGSFEAFAEFGAVVWVYQVHGKSRIHSRALG